MQGGRGPWKGAWPVEGGVPPARVPQATPPCPADARPTQPVPGTRAPTLCHLSWECTLSLRGQSR